MDNSNKTTNYETAYLLLRLTMGVNFLTHGLVRFPKLEGFRNGVSKSFNNTFLPDILVSSWATVLPFIEFIIGLFLILGIYTYRISIAGSIIIIALIFGSCLIEEWSNVGLQMVYAIFFSILISQIQFNKLKLIGK
ncbi:DoxX family protein [Winogradskyella ursingii]|uniref:DoxX family protein n=1 Tax=Winogradskyella ursingii TaxID=2686079 RepID=UPI0015CA10F8|nr:DoxX family protein [Winogradskyella ursingii]